MIPIPKIRLACFTVLFGVALIMAGSCGKTSTETGLRGKVQLDSLLSQREVFKARQVFSRWKGRLSPFESLWYRAQIGNAFNRLEQSNAAIDSLLGEYGPQLNDSLRVELLQLRLQNDSKLFHYRRAAATGQLLLNRYMAQLDSARLEDIRNEHGIWEGLSGTPAQTVVRKENTVIHLVEGYKIPVRLNDSEAVHNLLFDTGANLSAITSSVAVSAGLEFTGTECRVTGILGNEVKARVAVASTMSFGKVVLENTVFLVLPDSALYFPQANLQIEGILGYPVMEALGELRLTQGGTLIIPKQAEPAPFANLAMDYLTPVVQVVSRGDSMVFALDAGANRTWLYEKYYKLRQPEIDAQYKKTAMQVGGVGKAGTIKGYFVDLALEVGGRILQMDSVRLFPEAWGSDQRHFYGNLGQDVIGAFDTMTLNFRNMFVAFSD